MLESGALTYISRCLVALDIRHARSASAPESIDDLREMLGSLEAQLVSLYEEQEHMTSRANSGSPDEALTALYEDKQRLSARTIADLRASVDSMSTQLSAMYEDREQASFAASLATPDHAALVASLQSFEAQLHALYDEQARAPYTHHEAIDMVSSLEAQVAALLEERNELAEHLVRASADVTTAKRRARELVNAVLDQSFA